MRHPEDNFRISEENFRYTEAVSDRRKLLPCTGTVLLNAVKKGLSPEKVILFPRREVLFPDGLKNFV